MTHSDDIAIAVDGGGSGCRAAICDRAGRILGRGEGSPANVASSFDASIRAIETAIDTARARAGIDRARFADAPAWLGLAGVIDDAQRQKVAAALPFRRSVVTDDRPTGMAGALDGLDGCLVAAGTGSFMGRQVAGVQSFVGGWGIVLSDQASGAWMGRMLLQMVVDWKDGMRAGSPLLERTLAGYDSLAQMVFFSLEARPIDLAPFAPGIADAAEAGDASAVEIMRAGADWILRGLTSLGWQPGEPVCLSGGTGPRYRGFLPPEMVEQVIAPRATSLDGAVRLAAALLAEKA